jgi:1-acyl-sn-glycerol-3-phosphate acyltransferase
MTESKTTKNQPGWTLEMRDPRVIESWMPIWEWFYRYYFRVESDGWHNIPTTGQYLFVGSHNGGLASPDTSMVMYDWFRRFGSERLVYGLMHPNAWKIGSDVTKLAAQMGAVVAHPKMAIAAFQQGASVFVYPGGAQDVFRPHQMRDRIHFAGRKGFIKLALRQEVPIIPVISKGAHDTLIVLADLYEQVRQLHQWGMPWLFDTDPEVFPIYLGLPWILAIGPLPNFPLPMQIKTRVCRPIEFDYYGSNMAKDRDYVDECYDKVRHQMQLELDLLMGDRPGL